MKRQKSSKESMCGRKPSKISSKPYSAAIAAKVAMTWSLKKSDKNTEKEDGQKGWSNSRVSRKDVVRIKKDYFTAPSCKGHKNQRCWSTMASLRQIIGKMTSVGVKLQKICLLHGLSDPLKILYIDERIMKVCGRISPVTKHILLSNLAEALSPQQPSAPL